MASVGTIKYKNGSTWVDILHPVGSFYLSTQSTSPSSLFGGTWTPITGKFPYFNAGTGTGGSNSHAHSLGGAYGQFRYDDTASSLEANIQVGLKPASWTSSTGLLYGWGFSQMNRHIIGQLGTGIKNYGMAIGGNADSASNMPAYQTLYAWRRTA